MKFMTIVQSTDYFSCYSNLIVDFYSRKRGLLPDSQVTLNTRRDNSRAGSNLEGGLQAKKLQIENKNSE